MPRQFRKGFPKISLPDAIERVHKIFEQESRNPAPRKVVAEAMGYSGISGASSTTLAALIHYGLLEEVGDGDLRISEDALDILLGDPDREALMGLATRPPLFAELLSRFGTQVSDRNIEHFLIKNDYHKTTTRDIIRAYRETMDFVRAGDMAQSSISEPETSFQERASSSSEEEPVPRNTVDVNPDDESSLLFQISKISRARVIFSGRVTQGSIDKLIKFLELSKDAYPVDAEKDIPREEQQPLPAAE